MVYANYIYIPLKFPPLSLIDFKTILPSYTWCSYKLLKTNHCYSQKLPWAHNIWVGNLYLLCHLTWFQTLPLNLLLPLWIVACMCHAQHLNLASASRFWLWVSLWLRAPQLDQSWGTPTFCSVSNTSNLYLPHC